MASYPHNTASNKVKPWPAYFIVRTSGEVVPLIGVDELPIGTDLVGVPRSLDLKDTIGMLNLGIQRSSEAFYRIAEPEEGGTFTADTSKTTKATDPTPSPSKPTPAPQQTLTKPPRPFQETQTCRHWCTHGHCKWGQQCRYRHTMPLTHSGLLEIGLNDWPAWYRSLNPGYFADSGRTHVGRRAKASAQGPRPCAGGNGCCGDGCKGGVKLDATHVRAERLRGAGKERQRREDVVACLKGEKTMEALKEREREKMVSGTVLLERASMKDAKNWEDEGSESDESVGEKEKVVKTSLLD